jgi:hypothetical protein
MRNATADKGREYLYLMRLAGYIEVAALKAAANRRAVAAKAAERREAIAASARHGTRGVVRKLLALDDVALLETIGAIKGSSYRMLQKPPFAPSRAKPEPKHQDNPWRSFPYWRRFPDAFIGPPTREEVEAEERRFQAELAAKRAAEERRQRQIEEMAERERRRRLKELAPALATAADLAKEYGRPLTGRELEIISWQLVKHVRCKACHATGVVDGRWCEVCKGETELLVPIRAVYDSWNSNGLQWHEAS